MHLFKNQINYNSTFTTTIISINNNNDHNNNYNNEIINGYLHIY